MLPPRKPSLIPTPPRLGQACFVCSHSLLYLPHMESDPSASAAPSQPRPHWAVRVTDLTIPLEGKAVYVTTVTPAWPSQA